MDAKDRQIIRELQRDGRQSNLELAARVNLSPTPCLRRVRILVEKGVLRGYSANVDARAFGLNISAFIRITLIRHEGDNVRAFESRIRDIGEIMECYLLTGEADYLLHVLVEDLDAYENFVRNRLHGLPGIGSITTSLVYGTVKATRVFP